MLDTFSQLSTYLTESEKQVLSTCEGVIERGLKSFIEVGTALQAIRDNRLYRESFATFEAYCQDKWNLTSRHANRLIEAVEINEDLRPMGLELPINERQARPLSRVEPEIRAELWQTALDTAPNGKVTAAHVEQVVEEYKKYPLTAANHAISQRPDYDGDEWFTPSKFIEAAREVMGSIDLDPASCKEAQETVKAGGFFTKNDNGLILEWFGNVWVNPPYSSPLIDNFVEKLILEIELGNIDQAIILTNNSSDTRWFHSLLSRFPACFTRGRVQFWRPGDETFGARQGQTLFYYGKNEALFYKVFSGLGIVVKNYDH